MGRLLQLFSVNKNLDEKRDGESVSNLQLDAVWTGMKKKLYTVLHSMRGIEVKLLCTNYRV